MGVLKPKRGSYVATRRSTLFRKQVCTVVDLTFICIHPAKGVLFVQVPVETGTKGLSIGVLGDRKR